LARPDVAVRAGFSYACAMDMITLFDTVCTLVLIALLGMTIIVLWLGQ